jgi:hypothetical protein
MRIWKRLRRAQVDEELAARQATAAFEDPDSANPDVLAKLQRETTGLRAAWNSLTHRSTKSQWRGD